jgi:Domain of unknown function (DUF4129)
MTGRDRRAAALAPALAAGLLLLLWAANAGPVALLRPSGRRLSFDTDTPSTEPSASPSGARGAGDPREAPQTIDLSWLGDLLAWAVIIASLVGVALLARWVWLHRPRRPEAPPKVDVEVLPASELARILSEDHDAQLDAVSGGSPRNGIVRCWLRLEESVAAAGLPRARHETAAEFTVRVLHRLDLDPRAIGDLARLYREARFSEHELGEDARSAARSALESLHEDLRRLGALT